MTQKKVVTDLKRFYDQLEREDQQRRDRLNLPMKGR
jgi:hypothetical protein